MQSLLNQNVIHLVKKLNILNKNFNHYINLQIYYLIKVVKKCDYTNDKIKSPFSYCTFKNNCDKNALCIYNTNQHTYSCKCSPGLIGNGFKCYGKILKNLIKLFNNNN